MSHYDGYGAQSRFLHFATCVLGLNIVDLKL